MYLFFLSVVFGYSNGNYLLSKPPDPQHSLSCCLNSVIDDFQETNLIYAINVDLQLEKPVIRLDLNTGRLIWFKIERSEVCIVNLRNGSDLNGVLKKLRKNQLINPRSNFIVVVDKIDRSLFATAANFFIKRLLVVENGQKVYSYQPYLYESADHPSVDFFHWATCSSDGLIKHSKSTDGLPKKWKNTTIQALNNLVPPYSICPKCRSDRGIEIEAFDIIAQHLQFKVNYTREGFDYWGSKIDGSYSHILGDLEEHRGDMTIGVFHSKFEEHLDFDMSYTYMEDGTRWLVPKARILPYWKRISLIFSKEVYLSIFFSVAIMMVVCHILYNISYSSTWILLYQILLEYSLNKMPAFRIVIIVWTCCCLILSTMFKSKLIDTMSKNSYERQIDSLGDIVASKLHIIIDHDIAKFYDYQTNSDEEYVRKNYEFCPDPRICITRTAFEQDCVTIDFQRSNEFFLPQYVDPNGDVLLHLFKTPIFPVHIHLFFVKGYPIFPQIDQLLMRLRSNGVIEHLYDKAGYNARMAMSKKSKFSVEVLGLKQMQMAFLLWGVGIGASVLVFIIEYLTEIGE
ncbi:hypothetical protein BDFB_001396 [Asbolus verrucosus]|uniref:Lig chan domain containing protein n=1 Tax=Asbolus verrucosus TaxID=1661398 RepID=A0A482VQ32_ASBVE|nr:hypothetical protein BDFB_001396 [Asbolus verrucosus]